MQITAIAFQYQTIHLASYQSYQFQIFQYRPNQSTINEAEETLTKKQVKHAALMRSFYGAASGRYVQKKSVPSEKPNIEHEVSNANDKSQRTIPS
jgi:hypothetical protein